MSEGSCDFLAINAQSALINVNKYWPISSYIQIESEKLIKIATDQVMICPTQFHPYQLISHVPMCRGFFAFASSKAH
ncbi:hypothetical protein FD24_GL001696 [Lactiplantibacillus pentosus DSM 20314]|uniref:Uncharacterized protein n=1 Tax=Lactiplantibacillus pentosus DSM 20314 TaxID=1423791 RepID=A0A837R881_LACPE|nr:hypothetical protein FD24_GL001696 [Lactiplantibacillus pentosus DSM 20314]